MNDTIDFSKPDFHINELWAILNSVFPSNEILARSQWFDINRSDKLKIPEIKLWLTIWILASEDWLAFKDNPNPNTWWKVRDINKWLSTKTFALNCIINAIGIAFGIDGDVFLSAFRKWLIKNKPNHLTSNIELFDDSTSIQEPFESYQEIIEWHILEIEKN